MMAAKRTAQLMILVLGIALTSCNSYEGMIIAVRQSGDPASLEGAQLVLVDPDKTGKEPEVMFDQFHSSAAPVLNHEGRYLCFQAKESKDEPWQIWVADLKKNSLSRVTQLEENCTHPAILPEGSVVFSRESRLKAAVVKDLWKCGMDGCCLMRLTYDPSMNEEPAILFEGRILYKSSVRFPDQRPARLMIMRSDGSKSELYNAGAENDPPASGGMESRDGHIYFTGNSGKLMRVLHRRPLHTLEQVSFQADGTIKQAFACADSSLIISFLAKGEATYGLYNFMPGGSGTPQLIFRSDYHLLDPLRIEAVDPRPKILPSPVDPDIISAQLMIQDLDHSMLPIHEGIQGDSSSTLLRVSSPDGELALVEAKEDGSVYMKLDPAMPFRLETLNAQGEVLRGPSDWIYLQPNERRACTGCHANPELAPRNYQPHAVKEDPVNLLGRYRALKKEGQ